MVYKVYISTHETSEAYIATTQQALFAINDMGLSAQSAIELPGLGKQRHVVARFMIQQAHVFLAIYDGQYGQVPKGETRSYIALEYEIAVEQDIPRIIFVKEGALETDDARQHDFLEYVRKHNVINHFDDLDDLDDKVKVALDNYRQTHAHRRTIRPPIQTLRDQVPPAQPSQIQTTTDDEARFNEQVSDALDLVATDIEQIVRRALELHDAQYRVREVAPEDYDNKITVEPLWGEPIRRSQFESDIFMIMPFRDRFDAVYQQIIRPVVAELNLTIKRGDQFTSTRGSIIHEVWAALNACKLVIVETTEINANVYYELGIAHTLGKPAILLTQTRDIEQLPFDIRHLRFIVYDNTIEGSKKLEEDLRQAVIWLMNDLDEQDMPDA